MQNNHAEFFDSALNNIAIVGCTLILSENQATLMTASYSITKTLKILKDKIQSYIRSIGDNASIYLDTALINIELIMNRCSTGLSSEGREECFKNTKSVIIHLKRHADKITA